MRGEHDLSEYCLQDEGSSQVDSSEAADKSRPAWAEEDEERRRARSGHGGYSALPDEIYGDVVGGDSDDVLGVLGRSWQGGGDHPPNNAKGLGDERRERGDRQGEEGRDSGEEGGGGGGGEGGGNERDDSNSSRLDACIERNTDRGGEGGEAAAAAASYTRTVALHSATTGSIITTTTTNKNNGRQEKSSATGYARTSSSPFFPETDEDDDDDDRGGGARETESYPSSSATTPAAAEKPTRKGPLPGYGGGGGGVHNRRRSSGVSEEILTAGARALAEAAEAAEASMTTPSSATKSSSRYPCRQIDEGEMAGFSEDFARDRDGELKEGKGGHHPLPLPLPPPPHHHQQQHRLGPDEATPTSGSVGAYAAASTSAATSACAEYRPGQGWLPQAGVVDDEPTPRLYEGSHDAPFPDVVVGVHERACSPAGADGRFGPNGPHRPTLSLGSAAELELSGRGSSAERKQTNFGRCASGPLLKEGGTPYATTTPRYKATVADVQEAFERADTRLAREAAQISPRSENGEDGARQTRQLRGGGDAGDGQALKAIGHGAGLSTGLGRDGEVRPAVPSPREATVWIQCVSFSLLCAFLCHQPLVIAPEEIGVGHRLCSSTMVVLSKVTVSGYTHCSDNWMIMIPSCGSKRG